MIEISSALNIIFFGTFILNLTLGFLILIKNPKNQINKRFFCFAVIIAVWIFGLLMLQLQPYLFWGKFIYTFALLIPLSLNAFINNFLYPKKEEKDIIIIIFAILPMLWLH